jgi:soluble lytic murein transglycosylase
VAVGVARGPGWLARMQHPLEHADTIATAATADHVDPFLVAAVVNVESGFRPTVTSSAGAVGLMQVLPTTAKAVARHLGIPGKMNEEALKDPVVNIRVGTAYLAELLRRYHDDERLALAAYNAGISNADRWALGWSPGMGNSDVVKLIDFPATVNYVGEVLAQADVYRSLYPDAFPAPRK